MGSDDTRRYRATDSDAITQDRNTYGVYLHTPVPTAVLFTMTTLKMEMLELPSHDHGMHATCNVESRMVCFLNFNKQKRFLWFQKLRFV